MSTPRSEVAVEVPDELAHLLAELAVVRDRLPWRHGHLDEDDVLTELWTLIQELSERSEPLGDALGVIEAIDGQQNALALESMSKIGDHALHLTITLREGGELARRDADRMGLEPHDATPRIDAVHATLQAENPKQRVPEVLQVFVGVEGDRVGTEQPRQQFRPAGSNRNMSDDGKGMWRKKAILACGAAPEGAQVAASSGSRGPRPDLRAGGDPRPRRGDSFATTINLPKPVTIDPSHPKPGHGAGVHLPGPLSHLPAMLPRAAPSDSGTKRRSRYRPA